MPYNPKKHHRKSIRLKGYDYSQAGLYFITICAQDRACLLGNIENGEMILNDPGRLVENECLKLPQRFHNIELHEFVVMPDHFHAILEITISGATLVVDQNKTIAQNETVQPPILWQPQGIAPIIKPKTVGDMVGAFQSIVTVEYIRGVKQLGWQPFNGKLWQRNYWEHIIRNKQSYQRISKYIINNPKN